MLLQHLLCIYFLYHTAKTNISIFLYLLSMESINYKGLKAGEIAFHYEFQQPSAVAFGFSGRTSKFPIKFPFFESLIINRCFALSFRESIYTRHIVSLIQSKRCS